MCTQPTPFPGTPVVTPTVDLDALSISIDRCRWLALGLQTIQSGCGLPDGKEREGLCYELAAIIEETAKHAYRLASAL